MKDMQTYVEICVDDTEQPQIDLRQQTLICHILTNNIIFWQFLSVLAFEKETQFSLHVLACDKKTRQSQVIQHSFSGEIIEYAFKWMSSFSSQNNSVNAHLTLVYKYLVMVLKVAIFLKYFSKLTKHLFLKKVFISPNISMLLHVCHN